MDRRFERTKVDRLVLVDHLVSTSDRDLHFVLSQPVFLDAGSVITVDGQMLIVERPDGSTTQHRGGQEFHCRGWEPLSGAIGRRVE